MQPHDEYQAASAEIGLNTGMALASMIVGIVSIPLCGLGFLLGPIAIILGIVALKKIGSQPHVYGGRGFAITGIATGSTALVVVVPIIAAIAIPNLLAAKRAADEGSAISTLRTLHSAEVTYLATAGAGRCGDMKNLAQQKLIKEDLADGFSNDYRYEVVASTRLGNCEIHATPMSKGSSRSFIMLPDGILRGGKKNGAKAEKSDPVIETSRSFRPE